ncbi:M48 family metalloprotease [Methanolobus sp. ZRKC2]|uniref:M48 family metalloprotease n=1 Tax=Methanolobus sp. ZRKC2 TaxID=3125783 RepID=UPI003253AE30
MVPIVLVGFYLGGLIVGVLSAVISFILAWSIYRLSPIILLRWYDARSMSRETHSFVYSHLSELSSHFDVPLPQPNVFDSEAPITFIIGTNKKCYLLISTSSMDMLDEDELKSILTLEVAKISMGTVPVNTAVALFAGAIAAFSTITLWIAMFTGFGQKDDPAPRFISFLAMGVISLPCALLVHIFAVDSTMEVDRMAAGMMADTHLLSKTLNKTGTYIKLHVTDSFNPGHTHLFSMNPLKTNTIFDVYSSMFLTKPTVEQRISYFENIKDISQ